MEASFSRIHSPRLGCRLCPLSGGSKITISLSPGYSRKATKYHLGRNILWRASLLLREHDGLRYLSSEDGCRLQLITVQVQP